MTLYRRQFYFCLQSSAYFIYWQRGPNFHINISWVFRNLQEGIKKSKYITSFYKKVCSPSYCYIVLLDPLLKGFFEVSLFSYKILHYFFKTYYDGVFSKHMFPFIKKYALLRIVVPYF